jgi:hypothetical protein
LNIQRSLSTNSKKIAEVNKTINDNQSILVPRSSDQPSKITTDVIEIIKEATMKDSLFRSRKPMEDILDEDYREHESDNIE